MENTHPTIRLYDFFEETGGNIGFEANLPLAGGSEISVAMSYDPLERYLESPNDIVPRKWMAAIKRAVERPICDQLYHSKDNDFIAPDTVVEVAVPH